jgi:hypothetical protein
VLVGVRADHEVDARAGPGTDAIERTRGDDVPVDHRLPRQHAEHDLLAPAPWVGMRDEIGPQLRLRRKQAINGNRGDRLAGCRHAQQLGETLAELPCGRRGDHDVSRPTLGDGAPEQPLGAGHGQEGADAHRPGRLAEDGDVAGIAAEGGDVLLHPLEGGNLVEQAAVGVSLAQIEEPFGADPIVDRHADDAVVGETTAVIPGRRTRAVILEHPARNPDHHRSPGRPGGGGPDIEVQAVLTKSGKLRDEQVYRRRIRRLGRLRAVGEGVAHAAPGLDRPWRPEPIGAERWCGVGNAFERPDAIREAAAHLTMPSPDDGNHVLVSFGDPTPRGSARRRRPLSGAPPAETARLHEGPAPAGSRARAGGPLRG